MPRGVKTPPHFSEGDDRKLTITMHESDYLALQQLARDQYRTPELQAAWLLVQALAQPAPAALTDHATRILEKARAAQNGG